MTELVSAAEAPRTEEDRKNRTREIATTVAGLAIFGVLATVSERLHLLDDRGKILEFFQNSGRHFLVGYLGALKSMSLSKAETLRGKIGAALVGGLAADVTVEVGEAVAVTGLWHGALVHDRPQDLLGIFASSQLAGNSADLLAAEAAAVGAAVELRNHSF